MREYLTSNLLLVLKVFLVFFSPIKGIIVCVALATIVDTLSGIWRAKKLNEKVTSKKARHGLVPKLLSYCGAVMLIYTSDYFIVNELTTMIVSVEFISTKIIALVLISIEVASIDENFKAVKKWSFINKVVSSINKIKDIKKKVKNGEDL